MLAGRPERRRKKVNQMMYKVALDIKELFLFNFYDCSLFNDPLCLPWYSDWLSILMIDTKHFICRESVIHQEKRAWFS